MESRCRARCKMDAVLHRSDLKYLAVDRRGTFAARKHSSVCLARVTRWHVALLIFFLSLRGHNSAIQCQSIRIDCEIMSESTATNKASTISSARDTTRKRAMSPL